MNVLESFLVCFLISVFLGIALSFLITPPKVG